MRRVAFGAVAVLVALATLAGPDAAFADGARRTPSRCDYTCVFVLERGRYETVKLPFDRHQDFVRANDRGDIIGGYTPDNPPNDLVDYRGYFRDRRGGITLVDVPGAVATLPLDVNNGRQIVGAFSDTPDDVRRGFLRDRRGRYRAIHPPGAVQSQAFGINDRGDVVGEYLDTGGVYHAYLWRHGRFTTLDVPGAAATSANDINDRGQIVGISIDEAGGLHGFQLDDGRYATFDPPFGQQYLFPPAINNRGRIVGTAFTTGGDQQLLESHGFLLRDGVGGAFTRIDVPGAENSGAFSISDRGRIVGLYGPGPATETMPDAMQMVGRTPDTKTPRSPVPGFVADHGRYRTIEAADPDVQLFPGDITNGGEIVGEYLTPTRELGFRRDTRGRITTISLPGTASTQVDKTNRRGQIVGCYSTTSPFLPAGPGTRGYVLHRGRLTRIDVPGAVSTVAHGINDHGHVAGEYLDKAGVSHGYLWRHGRFTTIDVPGADGTQLTAINDRGEIVGIYSDTSGAIHGFLWRDGAHTTIDAPGATVTVPFDINDRGQIVVAATSPTADDDFAGARGFVLRAGAGGPFEEVRFPGAPRTLATGIDDHGRIVGIYENPNPTPAGAHDRTEQIVDPMDMRKPQVSDLGLDHAPPTGFEPASPP
jgi:probable HAF family extracellular repeat protein